ncbi:MAG: helix-turn-helix domain-containing protein [Candidatus Cryptobacteroides sp.]
MENSISEMGLFDVTAESMQGSGRVINADKNGFFFCRKGELEVVVDGKTFLVKENDILIYLPMSELYIHRFSPDLSGVIGMADFAFVYSSLRIVTNTYNYLYVKDNPCFTLTSEGRELVEELITAIRRRENRDGDPVMSQMFSSLAMALCYQIMHEYFSATPATPLKQDRNDLVFQNFMKALHSEKPRSREVAHYAEAQCLSSRYFSSIIKEKTGRSALQWITIVTIDDARRLLDNPNNSIKDVAFELGFPNQSFFGRYFKQYSGQSPSEYRMSSGRPL